MQLFLLFLKVITLFYSTVNNAGVGLFGALAGQSWNAIQSTFDTNVNMALFVLSVLCCRR